MRHPAQLLLMSVTLLACLAGCDAGGAGQGAQDLPSETITGTAAHPPVWPEGLAVTPPRATSAFPQASSGPGTPVTVPAGVQSDVVSFIGRELDQVTRFINDGNLDRAARTLDGIDMHRSSWSLATQEALAPKIAAVRKSLDGAVGSNS